MTKKTGENFMGRKVLIAPLDQIPPGLRVNDGALALTQAEFDAWKANDGETFKKLLRFVQEDDAAYFRAMGEGEV